MRWCSVITVFGLVIACQHHETSHGREPPPSAKAATVDQGGIFVSGGQGGSWRRSQHGFPTEAIVTEFARQGDRLFAATGAHGLWMSESGGRAWRRVESCEGAELSALAANDALIFAGTSSNGVLISRDRGETWTAE